MMQPQHELWKYLAQSQCYAPCQWCIKHMQPHPHLLTQILFSKTNAKCRIYQLQKSYKTKSKNLPLCQISDTSCPLLARIFQFLIFLSKSGNGPNDAWLGIRQCMHFMQQMGKLLSVHNPWNLRHQHPGLSAVQPSLPEGKDVKICTSWLGSSIC